MGQTFPQLVARSSGFTMGFSHQPSPKERAMENRLQELEEALDLQTNIIEKLIQRIEQLETQAAASTAKQIAFMLALRVVVQSSHDRDLLAQRLQVKLAQLSVQPRVLLDVPKDLVVKVQEEIDWILAPDRPLF